MAVEAKGFKRSGNLSKGKPRTVQKEHRNNLMPFQEAYIKAKGFMIGYFTYFTLLACLSWPDS